MGTALDSHYIQGGSNMTGTNCELFTHKQSRSYLNHLAPQVKKEEMYPLQVVRSRSSKVIFFNNNNNDDDNNNNNKDQFKSGQNIMSNDNKLLFNFKII
jgi:hypothetical protein